MKKNENDKVKNTKLKKIINIIEYILLTTIIVINITVIFKAAFKPTKSPDLFGKKAFIIISGSMIPTINVGDIVLLNSDSKVAVQDIIGFRNNYQEVIVHRVIDEKNIDNEIMYQTKGDNNQAADLDLVSYDDVEGVYFGKIPFIGKIIMFLHKNIAIIIVLLVLLFIIKFFL